MGGGAWEYILSGRLHGVTHKTGMDMGRIIICLLLLATSVSGADAYIGDTVLTGISEDGFIDGYAVLLSHADHHYTASAGDVVDSLSIYSWQSSGGTIKVALYDITSGDTVMVGSAETISPGAGKQVYMVNVNIELTAGNTYTVAAGGETGSVGWGYAALVGGQSRCDTTSILPATWVHASTVNARFVCFAPVTASGEPPEESSTSFIRRIKEGEGK